MNIIHLTLTFICASGHTLKLDPTVGALYNTETIPTGCVRLTNGGTIAIDMATPACNGFQCPRCFIYPPTNTSTTTLTISNCHAVLAYPQNAAGPYATDSNSLFVYTFVFQDTGSLRSFVITNVSSGGGTTSLTLTNGARLRTMICYNGKFYAE